MAIGLGINRRHLPDERHKGKAREILDSTVRDSGSYEAAADEEPRLVAVEAIEILKRPAEQIDLLEQQAPC
jgi:hypothetical protein